MLYKVTSTVFNVAVLVAALAAIAFTLAGHVRGLEGLLLMLGGTLATIVFGFRLAEGFDRGRRSIWAGPLSSNRPVHPQSEDRNPFRKAA